MDINKLINGLNGELKGTSATPKNPKAPRPSSGSGLSDKVSLKNVELSKNEELFAKLELEKLNQSSFERLKNYKVKLAEFEKAKKISPEAVQETEVGQKVNDPNVWSAIAQRILSH